MNSARFIQSFALIIFLCLSNILNASENIGEMKPFFDNYNYGELGFRKIEKKLINLNAKEHLIVAGDSNVFGDGCRDDETLTAFLSQKFQSSYVYNWGVRGGGPHDSLYLIQFQKALNLISQKKGIFIYDFFPFLYERVIGSKNYLKWTRKNSPYYELDDNSEVIYKGNFGERKFITGFYKFINHSKLLDWLIPKLPQIHTWHIELTAKIFLKMQQLYLAQFPEGKFVVVVNNTYDNEPDHIWQNKKLVKLLEEMKISTIVLSSTNTFKGNWTFKDGHINPEGQKIQAELLVKQLSR